MQEELKRLSLIFGEFKQLLQQLPCRYLQVFHSPKHQVKLTIQPHLQFRCFTWSICSKLNILLFFFFFFAHNNRAFPGSSEQEKTGEINNIVNDWIQLRWARPDPGLSQRDAYLNPWWCYSRHDIRCFCCERGLLGSEYYQSASDLQLNTEHNLCDRQQNEAINSFCSARQYIWLVQHSLLTADLKADNSCQELRRAVTLKDALILKQPKPEL